MKSCFKTRFIIITEIIFWKHNFSCVLYTVYHYDHHSLTYSLWFFLVLHLLVRLYLPTLNCWSFSFRGFRVVQGIFERLFKTWTSLKGYSRPRPSLRIWLLLPLLPKFYQNQIRIMIMYSSFLLLLRIRLFLSLLPKLYYRSQL